MKKINSSKVNQQKALTGRQQIDEKQMQMIVGGMNKGELVDRVTEKPGFSQRLSAFMESLTIYG